LGELIGAAIFGHQILGIDLGKIDRGVKDRFSLIIRLLQEGDQQAKHAAQDGKQGDFPPVFQGILICMTWIKAIWHEIDSQKDVFIVN
jgi:hypothetical protein